MEFDQVINYYVKIIIEKGKGVKGVKKEWKMFAKLKDMWRIRRILFSLTLIAATMIVIN